MKNKCIEKREDQLLAGLKEIAAAKEALEIQREFLNNSEISMKAELFVITNGLYSLPLFRQIFKNKRESK